MSLRITKGRENYCYGFKRNSWPNEMKELNFADDLLMSPAYLKAAAEKKDCPQGNAAQRANREDVAKAKNDLHNCLTLTLNKLIAPLLAQRCWNYAVDDKPISYSQSAALCFAIACVKSFANFSLRDV